MGAESWQTIRGYLNPPASATASAMDDAPTVVDAEAVETPTAASASSSAEGAAEENKAAAKDKPGDKPGRPTWQRIARGVRSTIPDPVNATIDRVSNAPTPGGLGVMLLALGVFLLAIVPVGPAGETRLLLMWKALLGNVTLPGGAPPSVYAQAQADLAKAEAGAIHQVAAASSVAQATAQTTIDGAAAALGFSPQLFGG